MSKNQHYVPQSYLTRFTYDGEHLFVYDKSTKREFETNIRNIAAEMYFYDLPDDSAQTLENAFARTIDNLYPNLVTSVLETVDKGLKISQAQRENIAFFMALQAFRTRAFRNLSIEIMKLLENAFQHLSERYQKEGIILRPDDFLKSFLAQDKEEVAKLEQIATILNTESVQKLVAILLNHIWVVGVNQTLKPLFTSDNPVAVWAHKQDRIRDYSGFRSEGVEIAFPLTSTHVLSLFERTYHAELIGLDGGSTSLPNADLIKHLNSMQVLDSHRWVYSASKSFDLIEEMGH